MGRGRPPNVPPPRPQRKGALAASIPCVGIFGNGRACQRCGLAVEEHDPAGNVADTLIEMVNSGHLSHEAVRRMLDEVTPIPSGAVEVSYPDGMNVKYASPSPYATPYYLDPTIERTRYDVSPNPALEPGASVPTFKPECQCSDLDPSDVPCKPCRDRSRWEADRRQSSREIEKAKADAEIAALHRRAEKYGMTDAQLDRVRSDTDRIIDAMPGSSGAKAALHRKTSPFGGISTEEAARNLRRAMGGSSSTRRPNDADGIALETVADLYGAATDPAERTKLLARRDELLAEIAEANRVADAEEAAAAETARIAKLPPPLDGRRMALALAWLEVKAIDIAAGVDPDTVELLTVPRLYELLGRDTSGLPTPEPAPDPQQTKRRLLDRINPRSHPVSPRDTVAPPSLPPAKELR